MSFLNGGNILVADGIVKVNAIGSSNVFPYVHTLSDPFPTGNFTLRIRMRYTAATGSGDGVQLARFLPPNGITCDFPCEPTAESGLPIAAIWGSILNVVVAHLDRPLNGWMILQGNGNEIPVGTIPEAKFHTYEIVFTDGRIAISVDGIEVGASTTISERPQVLWFGNPVLSNSNLWTEFEIDFIDARRDLKLGFSTPIRVAA